MTIVQKFTLIVNIFEILIICVLNNFRDYGPTFRYTRLHDMCSTDQLITFSISTKPCKNYLQGLILINGF